ncbi:MAG: amidohydrolase [Clostridiales Family XIII bacterium]|jgi:predicted amidohydrolase YtcJ|nr:amidohydrolase [Clostridiales Family XIII bacterium]
MRHADKILYSDAIFTGTGAAPVSGGVAVLNDKILAVGSRGDIEGLAGSDTERFELGDRLILPGLCDSHAHFMLGIKDGSENFCKGLDEGTSEADCVARLRCFADAHPDLKRFFGVGWFPANWGDAPTPTKKSIDEAFPSTPVYLECADGHSMWLNSAALAECGYTRDTVPNTGEIGRFPDGELDGMLYGGGMELTIPYARDLPGEELSELAESFMKRLNAEGLTAYADMDGQTPDIMEKEYPFIKSLEDDGKLTVRLYLHPGSNYPPKALDTAYFDEFDKYRPKFDSDLLRIVGVKTYGDCVTSVYTSALLEPYADRPDTSGDLLYGDVKLYENWVLEANKRGYNVRMHCTGDRAVRMALDCYEKAGKLYGSPTLRNVVEHVELINPADIPRFAELGVIAAMQPAHLPLELGEKLVRVGPERSRYEWAMGSILHAGGVLSLGSDYYVTHFSPFPALYAAVTRKGVDGVQYGAYTKGEELTLAEALRAYTWAGAYGNRMEDKTGTLEPGKYADIAVFSKNLFATEPEEWLEAKNVLTLINGGIVYSDI